MKLLGILLAISGPLAVLASNVLELDESNFDQYVGAGKPPALVELYVIQKMLNWLSLPSSPPLVADTSPPYLQLRAMVVSSRTSWPLRVQSTILAHYSCIYSSQRSLQSKSGYCERLSLGQTR